jgi:hypothetical protein
MSAFGWSSDPRPDGAVGSSSGKVRISGLMGMLGSGRSVALADRNMLVSVPSLAVAGAHDFLVHLGP